MCCDSSEIGRDLCLCVIARHALYHDPNSNVKGWLAAKFDPLTTISVRTGICDGYGERVCKIPILMLRGLVASRLVLRKA